MRSYSGVCLLAALMCVPLICSAQPVKRADLAPILSFEGAQTGGPPVGWGGGPRDTIFTDDKVVHGGKWAVRIERDPSSASTFSTITTGIPIDFTGSRLEMRGWLKTQDIDDFVGLWMREDGDAGVISIENMQSRNIKGTTDWTKYSITLPLNPQAKTLVFGVLGGHTGKVWADDLQLLVDGKAIWDVPVVEKPKTPIDLDHEFDGGSKITLSELSKTQIDNLAMLGKVWGFLKYHHPVVAAGERQWDYDLFRVMPRIVAAQDRAGANAVILQWIDGLGPVADCTACQKLDVTNLQLKPDLAWLSDEGRLGAPLSQALQRIYRNRVANRFYMRIAGGEKLAFDHEPAYQAIRMPDAGYQLLALFRYWNMVEYWFPDKDIIGRNWDEVLTAYVPRLAGVKGPADYRLELLQLVGEVRDTHANLWSSLSGRPPVGACQLPVVMRFVDGKAVVAGYKIPPESDPALKPGDIVTSLDGTALSELLSRWRPYYADSNEAARQRDMARAMTQGNCGPATIGITRVSETLNVTMARVTLDPPRLSTGATHDRPGDTFQKLSKDVAYLKLSSVKAADAKKYVDSASGTKGMIIDIRNYPSEFMVFALGSLLVNEPTDFSLISFPDPGNPGAFHWGNKVRLTPAQPAYKGKIVILVDEVSQSQSEYTTMALRSAPGAVVVGSTTAGADGDVISIMLPGGVPTMFSGLGIFYPDKTPTQQIGIIADVEVRPTIEGLRDGRDEVLEAGIRQILGPDVAQAEIEAMAKH